MLIKICKILLKFMLSSFLLIWENYMMTNSLVTESQLMESHLTESQTGIRKWLNPYQIARISWDSISRGSVARDSVIQLTNYHNCKIDCLSFGIFFILWDQNFCSSNEAKMLKKNFKWAKKVQKLQNTLKVDKI